MIGPTLLRRQRSSLELLLELKPPPMWSNPLPAAGRLLLFLPPCMWRTPFLTPRCLRLEPLRWMWRNPLVTKLRPTWLWSNLRQRLPALRAKLRTTARRHPRPRLRPRPSGRQQIRGIFPYFLRERPTRPVEENFRPWRIRPLLLKNADGQDASSPCARIVGGSH